MATLPKLVRGLFFKDEEAFNNKKGICYISEYQLRDLEDFKDKGMDLTDEQIIDNYLGETYDTIVEQCEVYYEDADEESPEVLAEIVFDIAEWATIATELESMTQ